MANDGTQYAYPQQMTMLIWPGWQSEYSDSAHTNSLRSTRQNTIMAHPCMSAALMKLHTARRTGL